MSNLTTISVNDFCWGDDTHDAYSFYIPSYQRGYRWDSLQVEQLLEDLWEFGDPRKPKKPNEYYCLQPIIVKEKDGQFEVVDGQQRLITVYLILKYLYKDDNDEPFFRLTFERDLKNNNVRENFIANIEKSNEEKNILDIHYFNKTWSAIGLWVKQKREELHDSTVKATLQSVVSKNTRFIWYELEKEIDGREVFRHINDGKIRLTDSELIKAMLLDENNFSNSSQNETDTRRIRMEQERIARLWDEMERTLQNQNFWSFIGGFNQEQQNTRIDYLFELIRPKELTTGKKEQPLETFRYFEHLIKQEKKARVGNFNGFEIWNQVCKIYRTFCDWYSDVEFHNYIGYITHYNVSSINDIKQEYGVRDKNSFKSWIKDKIFKHIGMTDETNVANLSYENDRPRVEKNLMAFNVITAIKQGFLFDFSIDGGWSVEHIYAQNSNDIEKKDRGQWIADYLEIGKKKIEKSPKNKKLEELIRKIENYNENDFDEIFYSIITIIEESSPAILDTIANFALLGKNDNAALGCSAFYKKRQKIINMAGDGLDSDGQKKHNIPVCTLNVFMKFYSDSSDIKTNSNFWSEEDGVAYRKNFLSCLKTLKEGN
jgi:uncharacterized protein with ParB-like and HNH nuclease domain